MFTSSELRIPCTHKYLNSMCLVFTKPLLAAILRAPWSVHVRPRASAPDPTATTVFPALQLSMCQRHSTLTLPQSKHVTLDSQTSASPHSRWSSSVFDSSTSLHGDAASPMSTWTSIFNLLVPRLASPTLRATQVSPSLLQSPCVGFDMFNISFADAECSVSCASYFSSSPSHLDAIDPLRRGRICSDLLRYVSPRTKLEHFQSPQSCNPLPFFCLSPLSLGLVRLQCVLGSRWTTGILPARLLHDQMGAYNILNWLNHSLHTARWTALDNHPRSTTRSSSARTRCLISRNVHESPANLSEPRHESNAFVADVNFGNTPFFCGHPPSALTQGLRQHRKEGASSHARFPLLRVSFSIRVPLPPPSLLVRHLDRFLSSHLLRRVSLLVLYSSDPHRTSFLSCSSFHLYAIWNLVPQSHLRPKDWPPPAGQTPRSFDAIIDARDRLSSTSMKCMLLPLSISSILCNKGRLLIQRKQYLILLAMTCHLVKCIELTVFKEVLLHTLINLIFTPCPHAWRCSLMTKLLSIRLKYVTSDSQHRHWDQLLIPVVMDSRSNKSPSIHLE